MQLFVTIKCSLQSSLIKSGHSRLKVGMSVRWAMADLLLQVGAHRSRSELAARVRDDVIRRRHACLQQRYNKL